MTAFDFEGNDWDEITEREKRDIVQRLVDSRDALSDDYETLAAEHDKCPTVDADRLARAITVVWSVGHHDLRSGLTEGGTDLADAIVAEYDR